MKAPKNQNVLKTAIFYKKLWLRLIQIPLYGRDSVFLDWDFSGLTGHFHSSIFLTLTFLTKILSQCPIGRSSSNYRVGIYSPNRKRIISSYQSSINQTFPQNQSNVVSNRNFVRQFFFADFWSIFLLKTFPFRLWS